MSLRPLALVLVPATLLGASAPARAEDQLGGGQIQLTLKLPSEDGGTPITPTVEDRKRYFNQARCLCDLGASQGEEELYYVEYSWVGGNAPASTTADEIVIWAGQGCDAEPTTRDLQCTQVDIIDEPSDITLAPERPYRVSDLLLKPNDTTCPESDVTTQHWAVTQMGVTWNQENKFSLASTILGNMRPPAVPGTLTARALENGLTLSWSGFDADDDTLYYQALCAREDGSQVRSPLTRQYETTDTLCGIEPTATVRPATLTGTDGDPVGPPPDALLDLDESFICAQAGPTASSITIDGLVNDLGYWVVLVAVDDAGNYSAVYVDRPLVPREVTDFWEEINNEDGNVSGGFCISQVGSDGAAGGAVLVALAAMLAARRRRRRGGPRGAARIAALGLVLVALAPAAASAQNYSPYWLEEDPEAGFSTPSWNIGFRLGPYVPSIDEKFDSSPGPYARTFKKDTVMFAVDLHRTWDVLRGQLGIGGTAGYYGNSTNAFVQGSDPTDPDRPRAVGNTTSIRMVPLQLTAIYRATVFHDELGVPLVPYLRGGLGYYVWWMRSPSGELSHAMSCETCDDRALGASIGVVGAVGLAVRAEQIDGDAARSMRDSGFEHAGFFVELEHGWVDGFGNEKRLSLGDTTWFGGINFEF